MYRLWQDAENRVYLIKELDRITGQVGFPLFFFFKRLNFGSLWLFVCVWSRTYVIPCLLLIWAYTSFGYYCLQNSSHCKKAFFFQLDQYQWFLVTSSNKLLIGMKSGSLVHLFTGRVILAKLVFKFRKHMTFW